MVYNIFLQWIQQFLFVKLIYQIRKRREWWALAGINPAWILIGNVLLNRKAALRVKKWISEDRSIEQGLRQGSVFSPALFNVYTAGFTSNWLGTSWKTQRIADDVLVYSHSHYRYDNAASLHWLNWPSLSIHSRSVLFLILLWSGSFLSAATLV